MDNFFSNVWGGIKSIGNFLNPLAVGTAKAPAPKTGYNVYGELLGPYDLNRPSTTSTNDYNPYAAISAKLDAQAAAAAQRARVFSNYGSFDKSIEDYRSGAESLVNPIYEKKWATAEEGFKTQKARAKEDYNIGAQLEADALNRFLERSGLLKTRSKEDLMTALSSLANQRGDVQAETRFERVRQLKSLVNDLASRGLSFGGMAKTAGKEAIQGRMLAKNKLERQYGEAVASEQTKEKRTGEDIVMQEQARQAENKARLDELLRTKTRTLEDVAYQRKVQRQILDMERQDKINTAMYQKWNQAYQVWDIGLKNLGAQYGYNF